MDSHLRKRCDTRRFFRKFEKRAPDECWPWTAGRRSSMEYGEFWDGRRSVHAHRWSYEHHVGVIPTGLCVLHTCDNPICVNPLHLFVGTNDDNVADRQIKGRQAKGEEAGSAKLLRTDVLEIRGSDDPGRILAEKYGVSIGQIYRVRSGADWKHVPGSRPKMGVRSGEGHHNAKLTEDAVRHIRSSGRSTRDLAAEYGVSAPVVWYARVGRTWRHVK